MKKPRKEDDRSQQRDLTPRPNLIPKTKASCGFADLKSQRESFPLPALSRSSKPVISLPERDRRRITPFRVIDSSSRVCFPISLPALCQDNHRRPVSDGDAPAHNVEKRNFHPLQVSEGVFFFSERSGNEGRNPNGQLSCLVPCCES